MNDRRGWPAGPAKKGVRTVQCQCGSDNPADSRFCGECGSELARTCDVCGASNPARFRFCGNCGAPLPDAVDGPDRSQPWRRRTGDGPARAERRHLTVMFCDLVGSTALSLQLDPEELREVVRAYQAACAEVIERFDGYVAQYLGDGILAYFGYPIAHEDEGGRSVRAGLGIVQAVHRLSGRLDLPPGTELAVRVGIHTGEVVVGEIGGGARRENLALGDAPNIAARIQSLAAPDTVVVSGETHRLVDRAITFEDLGEPALSGVGATHVYRVIGETLPDAIDVAGTEFVGRQEEIAFLHDRWADTQEGEGQVVVLIGDPGIGKSKLVREFIRDAGFSACNRLETRCLPYYRNTAFFPFTDLLRRSLGCDPEAPAEARLQLITGLLERQGFPLEDTVPLIANLMSVPVGGEYAPPTDPPALQKERTRAVLAQILVGTSQDMPLILVFEDLHWADPSSMELLDELVPLIASERLMVLFTARPEAALRWTDQPHVKHLVLQRLSGNDVEALVKRVTGGRALPDEVLSAISARTDGVPLFVEELTRMVIESGLLTEHPDRYELNGPLPSLAIPGTLRDSLEARLDRLGGPRELAQLAASLGREFSYDLIDAVADVPPARLREGLEALVDAGLLIVEGEPPDANYAFKHALIQEAAYQSLLRTTRQAFHIRIAETLVTRFAETARTQPEILAEHYTAAGQAEQAVEAWTRAGRLALQRSANAEAVAHLTQGLEQVRLIADPEWRARAELDLLTLLGPALITTQGYTAPAVRENYERALEIAEASQRTRHISQTLAGLFAHHYVRGELNEAARMAMRLDRLANQTGETEIRLVADIVGGIARFVGGRFEESLALLERVRAAYDPQIHGPLAVSFGQDFGVLALAYSGYVFGMLGDFAEARRRSLEAVASAERVNHPHSLALALALRGGLHQVLLDDATVTDVAGRLRSLSVAEGFEHWEMEALHLQSWLAARAGRFDDAFELTAAFATTARRVGAELPQAFYQPTIIFILLEAGRAEDALRAAEDLLAVLGRKKVEWAFESEIRRLRGRALAALHRNDEAQTAFRDAAARAASGNARLLELRATLDLFELELESGEGDSGADIARLLDGFEGESAVSDIVRARSLLATRADTGAAV